MNFKYILLSVLLVPFVTASYGNGNNDQMQKVIEELNAKERDLKELGKKITEQEDVISLIDKKIHELRQAYITKKIGELSKKNLKPEILEQEINDINDFLAQDLINFKTIFLSKFSNKETPKNIVSKAFTEHFKQEDDGYYAMLKFNVARYALEQMLLIGLLTRWENSVEELNNMYNQIILFKKNEADNN